MTTTKFQPQDVIIRHGMFWYMAKEQGFKTDKDTGALEEAEVIVQRVANQNEKATLSFEADYRRGLEHHAFWTEEEIDAAGGENLILTPAESPDAAEGPRPALETGNFGGPGDDDADEIDDPMDHDISTFNDEEDIRDWLTGTGQFDGARKPNVDEVLEQVGNNADLAARVHAAEKATRDRPRTKLTGRLEQIQSDASPGPS